jgi:putative FmdB family regulatory protein
VSSVPLFEYECRECNSRFEQLVLTGDAEASCRQCGSANVSRLLSTFAVGGKSDNAVAESNPCSTCGAAERGMCGMN